MIGKAPGIAIDEIYFAALGHADAGSRAAYLDDACGADAELRGRVERLLDAQADRGSFLESPALDPTVAFEPLPAAEGPGTAIGPYTLREVIGEGGMGTVFLADQAEPVRRRVALKVIKPGMDTKQVIARFEAERQALALMDHPNIARVLDAGATDSGRPFFVMELVRGLPITDYCDQHQLSVPERLDLFVLVCRAVQHAHQKGIIHRDLKPSNVLVTVIDGAAVPKVIDFGIAKATGAALTEGTVYTGFHQLVGTPLYMSPEQAELSGTDVDTRSDIYSLGVLLYELLTGTTPFDPETLKRAAFDELRRILREQEPPTPSTRLGALGPSLSTVSARRKADPRRLGPSLRSELDWVVMKALEKDRRRRYETANDFAADVMRYLTDRPVEACPPSSLYRFGKFARRNRATLTTAVLLSMAMISGTAVSAWQAARALRAEEETRLVVEYLIRDVFGATAPEKARGRTVTVNDLLASGEEVIPERFGRRPRVEAAAREALGRAYLDLGRYGESARQFLRAAELRSRLQGPRHPETLHAEAWAVRALCPPGVYGSGDPDQAEPIARRVLESSRRALGPQHPRTLASMTDLARVLWSRQGLINRDRAKQYPPSEFPSLTLPDDVLRASGATLMGEAKSLAAAALAAQVGQLGPNHPETLESLSTLGCVRFLEGDFVAAEQTLSEAAERRRVALGPGHPATLQSRKYRCHVLFRLGRADEVIRLAIEVAEGHRRTFGPTHGQTHSVVSLVTFVLRREGDAARLRAFCERWLREILATPVDPDRHQRSRRCNELWKLAINLSLLPGPIPFDADLAVRAMREVVGLDDTSLHWSSLGVVLDRAGRHEEAREAFETATTRPDWQGGSGYHWFALARIHARGGDPAGARACYERGLDAQRSDWRNDLLPFLRDEAEALLREAGWRNTSPDAGAIGGHSPSVPPPHAPGPS